MSADDTDTAPPAAGPHACGTACAPADLTSLMASAEALCAARGTRLTPQRQAVLRVLAEAGQPLPAYEILSQLQAAAGKPVGPPTVYRALDFLVEHGLAVKVESRNAFVLCHHPDEAHDHLFFVCKECGAARELVDPEIARLLARAARSIGFETARRVVEVEGVCDACAP